MFRHGLPFRVCPRVAGSRLSANKTHTERESGVTEGQHQPHLHQQHHQNQSSVESPQTEGTRSIKHGWKTLLEAPLQAQLAAFTASACLLVEETDGKTPSSRGHVFQVGQLLIQQLQSLTFQSGPRYERASTRELHISMWNIAVSKGSRAQEETPARTHHRGVCVCPPIYKTCSYLCGR